jgi:uncharacterized damage-inducible protein DinB
MEYLEGVMSPEEIRILYDYNAWANHRSLEAAAALSAEQFVKPLGSSFSSVRDTLAHIWGSEWLWLERFQGRSPASLPDIAQFNDIAALKSRWQEDEVRLLKFVAALSAEDLSKVHEYRTFNFGQYKNPLWQSMQHMVNHGTYHRGQVVTMLRQLNVKPLSSDLIHFYRERAQTAGA